MYFAHLYMAFVGMQFLRLHFCRPSSDFQPFESAAAPPVRPMQASPVVPVAASEPMSSAGVAMSNSIDLLGDLDLSPPSMPLSMHVQPERFAVPPATAQSSVFDTTMPVSNTVVIPEAAMTFTTLQPNALTTSTLMPVPAPTAALVESSVCILNIISGFPASYVLMLYI